MTGWKARLVTVAIVVGVSCTPDASLVPARGEQGGDTTASDTTGTDTTSTDTTAVQRAALTVVAEVSPGPDATLAEQLGFGDVLPGATVTARREFSTRAESGTTDDAGTVTFTELLPGTYQISVLRILTEEERGLLGPADADVDAFGGGRTTTLSPPATETAVSARATRRGSLVISEIFPTTWIGDGFYRFGGFIEIYNNADTTIFLDGKLVGNGPTFFADAPNHDRPCSLTQQWQADADGLWTPRLWRLPGTGQQYPLAPGETAVLATDAVDHRDVDPRWPDLSNAEFEFFSHADVDNPAAGNITQVGTPAFSDVLGHGPWFSSNAIWFLADTTDVDDLPAVQPPNFSVPIPRIPRNKILDVVTFMLLPQTYIEFGTVLCEVLISPVFDTGPAFWMDNGTFMSIRRKPLGNVLLRSGSTVSDFEVIDPPTPGRP